MKLRKIIAYVLLAGSLVLVGFSFWQPESKNSDKPFIDLAGTTGIALGNAKKAEEYANPVATPPPAPVTDSKFEVKVSGETILFDGKEIEFNYMNSWLNRSKYGDREVVLVDDYAESITYKRVRRLLDEQGRLGSETTVR